MQSGMWPLRSLFLLRFIERCFLFMRQHDERADFKAE